MSKKVKSTNSYWNILTAGISNNTPKRKFWFTIVPGVGFKAVSLGKTRQTWFNGTEHLIMYRNSFCCIEWIPESELIER
jgi:hypothetical protein